MFRYFWRLWDRLTSANDDPISVLKRELARFQDEGLILLVNAGSKGELERGRWTVHKYFESPFCGAGHVPVPCCPLAFRTGFTTNPPGKDSHGRSSNPFTNAWDRGQLGWEDIRPHVLKEAKSRQLDRRLPVTIKA